jgi:hypothetical protein
MAHKNHAARSNTMIEKLATEPKRNEDITQAMRDELVGLRGITLDGEAAAITGRLCDFPRIIVLDKPHIQVEYSWMAVYRTVTQRNGAFKSW